MNYYNNYWDYINYVLTLNRKKLPKTDSNYIYYEKHHILPKSLYPEYSKLLGNFVLLTPREHYLAHYLLWKIYNRKEMIYAFWLMNSNNKYKIINSKIYEIIRIENSKQRSILQKGEGNSFYGKKHTNKAKQKISKIKKGK